MSLGTLINFAVMSAILGLGQWLFFKLFNGVKIGFVPLFGSLLLTNIAIFLVKGMIR